MGSCEDPVTPQNPNDQTELGESFAKPEPHANLLAQLLENVALKDREEGETAYPLRPFARDCQFYIRTGSCKFGLDCKFNHPVTRKTQAGKEGEIEEGLSEMIECKYYLTAGGCKFGNSCRYSHSKEANGLASIEYNFLGLPIREGEIECPYYMRTGSCGYGANCRFHHPEPTSVGDSEPNGNDESVGGFDNLGNYNGESTVLNLSGASQPSMASWSSHMLSNRRVSYSDTGSSYVPAMHSFPQGEHPKVELNWHQAPIYSREMPPRLHSGLALDKLKEYDVSQHYEQSQVEEFPEQPGKPDCDYYIKTGDCKYKSACRYHHPKSRVPGLPACALSDKGLPLRPGKKICWHYESYGICKYGRACLFDHPLNHSPSPFPAGTKLDNPLSRSSANAGGNRTVRCEDDEIQASGWE